MHRQGLPIYLPPPPGDLSHRWWFLFLADAWTIEELQEIIAVAAETPGTICGIRAGHWWTGFIRFPIRTALRVELNDLRLDGMLRVTQLSKGLPAKPLTYLPEETFSALISTLTVNRKLFFPWQQKGQGRYRSIVHAFLEILERAHLPHSEQELLRKLRRTRAAMADGLTETDFACN